MRWTLSRLTSPPLQSSGSSLVSVMIGSALAALAIAVAFVLVSRANKSIDAFIHYSEIHRAVVLISKSSVHRQESPGQASGDYTCDQLNIKNIDAERSALPTDYPKVIHTFTDISVNGHKLISVGEKRGELASLELVQLAPPLSNFPAFIFTEIRMKSAKLKSNEFTADRRYSVPLILRLDALGKTEGCQSQYIGIPEHIICRGIPGFNDFNYASGKCI